MSRYRDREHHRDRSEGPKRPVETFITGLIMTVVFGVLLKSNFIPGFPSWVFGFPLLFGGVIPMIRGLSGMVRGGVSRVTGTREGEPSLEAPPPAAKTDTKTDSERKILMLAREEGGIVTPAIAALKTDLSLDMAGELLDDLARRGYAGMQVKEDGRVEYHFPEFERRRGESPGS